MSQYSPTFSIDHFVVGRQPSCPTFLCSREVFSVTTHRQHWLPATTLCLPVNPSASFLGESEAACFRDLDTIVFSIAHSPIIRLRRSRGYLRRSLCQPTAWTSSGQSDLPQELLPRNYFQYMLPPLTSWQCIRGCWIWTILFSFYLLSNPWLRTWPKLNEPHTLRNWEDAGRIPIAQVESAPPIAWVQN